MASTAQKKKATKQPRYVQLADTLRGEISAGKYAEDTSFPTETELCKRYDVSRFTVREALRSLQDEGLIERKRGSGTTVQPAAARGGALHQPLSNVDEILQYAHGSEVEYAPVGDGPLPADIAEQFACDTSGNWSYFKGVRTCVNATLPFAVTDAYLHERLGEAIDKLDLGAGLLFSQIERFAGIRLKTVTQEIQAIAADPEIAEALALQPGDPVLRILRCYADSDGTVFEISASHHPGERFVYSMHIDADD